MIRHCQFTGGCEVVTQVLRHGKWTPAIGPFCSKHNTPEKRRGAALALACLGIGHVRRTQ